MQFVECRHLLPSLIASACYFFGIAQRHDKGRAQRSDDWERSVLIIGVERLEQDWIQCFRCGNVRAYFRDK
jgi:hypothetical protein